MLKYSLCRLLTGYHPYFDFCPAWIPEDVKRMIVRHDRFAEPFPLWRLVYARHENKISAAVVMLCMCVVCAWIAVLNH